MLGRITNKYPFVENIVALLVVLFSSIVYSIAMNKFLLPGHIYSGGLMGFAQILSYFINHYTPWANMILPGQLNFILNIPIITLAFIKLGKRFTFLTLCVVFGISFFSSIIPVTQVSENPLLNGIMGGVLGGIAVGTAVRFGLSAGGTDIISVVVFRATGVNVGSVNLLINLIIISFAGNIYSWEYALYTLISMYASARCINFIHTNEKRLTVFIVTDHVDAVLDSIFSRLRRGVTILDGRGGYSREPNSTLMIVVNQYELYDLQMAIAQGDPEAFVNIIQSTRVIGNFLNKQQQDKHRFELKYYQQLEAERKLKRHHQ